MRVIAALLLGLALISRLEGRDFLVFEGGVGAARQAIHFFGRGVMVDPGPGRTLLDVVVDSQGGIFLLLSSPGNPTRINEWNWVDRPISCLEGLFPLLIAEFDPRERMIKPRQFVPAIPEGRGGNRFFLAMNNERVVGTWLVGPGGVPEFVGAASALHTVHDWGHDISRQVGSPCPERNGAAFVFISTGLIAGHLGNGSGSGFWSTPPLFRCLEIAPGKWLAVLGEAGGAEFVLLRYEEEVGSTIKIHSLRAHGAIRDVAFDGEGYLQLLEEMAPRREGETTLSRETLGNFFYENQEFNLTREFRLRSLEIKSLEEEEPKVAAIAPERRISQRRRFNASETLGMEIEWEYPQLREAAPEFRLVPMRE